MIVKISELTGTALDYAVAKCEETAWEKYDEALYNNKPTPPRPSEYLRDYTFHPDKFNPSTNWLQGGPIIEREKIVFNTENGTPWRARFGRPRLTFDGKATNYHHEEGPTPLIAAMRCYVSSKYGEEIEIPDELFT